MFPNWIQVENPYNLATPPAYFFTQLAAYDVDLVVFPSTCEPLYRLSRRSDRVQPIFHTLAPKYPDLKVCIEHRLVPITSILPASMCLGDPWPDVFEHLERLRLDRLEDTAHASAADRFTDKQDALDRAWEAERRRENEDRLHVLSGDFHRLITKAKGERIYENEPENIVGRGQQAPFDFRPGGSSVMMPGVNQSQERASVTGKKLIVLADR
jgi:hypothetical protein